ncbi:1,3-beta-glucanosyltransferase [Maudiozyma humilis]|uniref:1,3-beta-glucanosyltransferase n=1 Tax=Maudiozyma humilis TaxID=51915 RepID=A0AAV5S0R8_MAUHU|nr:1,3-beta-glucanosyltransferase [Kazachstania humilis]
MVSRIVVHIRLCVLLLAISTLCTGQPYDDFPVIHTYGNKFFNSSDGMQFFIKGIAYQPQPEVENNLVENNLPSGYSYIDPLADPNLCLRDIPYLQELHVNTIRVYSIDPEKSHDVCMEALMQAGIYVLSDLSEPDTSVVRDNPTWDTTLLERYKQVVDSLQKYPNVLGFFAGNEVTNDITNTGASPFVKAAIRDTKEHIRKQGYRSIPVGYSSNDDLETRDYLDQYFICGNVTADFYGVNMYEWCGYSTYQTSGYKERTDHFKNYPVPVFFSEFGCNLVQPRPFSEVKALFGKQMTEVWSGGLAYMYFEESNNYGVVHIHPVTGEVVKLQDFENLSNGFRDSLPKKTSLQDALDSSTIQDSSLNVECPFNETNWNVSNIVPPTPDPDVCDCIQYLPCVSSGRSSDENYSDYFDTLCGDVDCSDISANGNDGTFGKYSFCTLDEKISLVASKWYFKHSSSSKECPYVGRYTEFNNGYIPHSRKGSAMCDVFEHNIRFSSKWSSRGPVELEIESESGIGDEMDIISDIPIPAKNEEDLPDVESESYMLASNAYGKTIQVKRVSLYIVFLILCAFF